MLPGCQVHVDTHISMVPPACDSPLPIPHSLKQPLVGWKFASLQGENSSFLLFFSFRQENPCFSTFFFLWPSKNLDVS